MSHYPHCPHNIAVKAATSAGALEVCLECRRVRSSPRLPWRNRIKADGIDSRWIVGMRKSLGLEPGPYSQPWR
jgi:hypothetical protein